MTPEKNNFITEEEKTQIALNRIYSQRFEMLIKLIRIDRMLKSAKMVGGKIKGGSNGHS